MSNKSERAYSWIDAKTARLGKWIDNNIARLLIIAVFTGLAMWGFLLEEQENLSTGQRLVRSLGPSLAGIVIAAVTIEALAERRLEQERKAQLIRQMGSKYRDVTEMAIIELRHKGWLEDGSLNGADLSGANLSGASLWKADLSRAKLEKVDLSNADLSEANLSGVSLWKAELSGAKLEKVDLSEAGLGESNLSDAGLLAANLSRAILWEANLSRASLVLTDFNGASLWHVNLSGANLWGAYLHDSSLSGINLSGVNSWTIMQLERAMTLEGAIMPDGVQLKLDNEFSRERINGPTFEEWKAQYLAKHGGEVYDKRHG